MLARPSIGSLFAFGIALVTSWVGCSLDSTGTGQRSSGQQGSDAAIDAGDDPVADGGRRDGGRHDAGGTRDDAGLAPDSGHDAATPPPPPPPPTRLWPHLAGSSVGRSRGYRLYHAVGAPRFTGASVPRGTAESAHFRLTTGLSAAPP